MSASLEEALKEMPPRSSPPASQEAKQAMAAAFMKSQEPQIRAAGEWLAGKLAKVVKA
jgi:hypothetical protein